MGIIKEAGDDYVGAATRLDELCQSLVGHDFGMLPVGPEILKALEDDATDVDSLKTLIKTDKMGELLSAEQQESLASAIIKERMAGAAKTKAMDTVLREDRGWPHRSAVECDRAKEGFCGRTRDPQRWFTSLDKKALDIRAIQEGDDPDRYIPDVTRDLLFWVLHWLSCWWLAYFRWHQCNSNCDGDWCTALLHCDGFDVFLVDQSNLQ